MWIRLEKEGKVTLEAKVLLVIGKKLVAKFDIVQHEVISLRKVVIHEKKKWKRGKKMFLWEEGENEN